jgi:hypothetical protein
VTAFAGDSTGEVIAALKAGQKSEIDGAIMPLTIVPILDFSF